MALKCPHIKNVVQLSPADLCKIKQGQPCSECNTIGPNLWICLQRNCLHTGCSEQANDHSTEHFKLNQQHCVHMNLSSQRIWCYLCETEVFLNNNNYRRNSIASINSNYNINNNFNTIDSNETSNYFERMYDQRSISSNSNNVIGGIGYNGGGYGETDSNFDEDDMNCRNMDGLVGLQNIANTCYMNAALQALSNSPPLLSYFLQCGDIIEASSDLSGNQRKPGLAKSYHRLIKTMWCRNRKTNGYVVPRDILTRIRNVHPMFRGYQQHDTQEFLRCFMDQLHEELKEISPLPSEYCYTNNSSNSNNSNELMTIDNDDDPSPCSTPSPSQSEADEYETCDSGVSERSSLSDDHQMTMKRTNITASTNILSSSPRSLHSSSTSPTLYQRNSIVSQPNKPTPHGSPNNLLKSNSSTSGISNSGQQQNEKQPPKRPHRSIISDVFDGKLLSSVQCLTCNRISTREETFQDLSLPIPGKDHLAVLHQTQGLMLNMSSQQQQSGVTCTDVVYQAGQDGWIWWIWNWLRSWFWGPAVSLHDCMAAFFSADELKGDNMYSCEKCHKLRNGIKYSRVLELPEMLCVHLKRFRHDLSYSSKISSPVQFPLTGLDMRPYLHKDCKSEVSNYDLTAVICHHGTVGSGHYTSFARHELTGKWFEFDDQLVTEVSSETVQNCQAYVLFYRKSNPNMSMLRAHAKELADSNPIQSSDLRFYISRQWINRFNTFAEPGPIDNYTMLCPHGGLPPGKAALASQLAVPLQQPLWDFLYKHFGGGPICNRLFECNTCHRAAEQLSFRQDSELEAFNKLKIEFQNENTPTTIYAISMAWFRQWQLFAEGKTNEEPGPICNAPIAVTTTTTSELGITTTITSVRPGSDYAQLNRKLWKFFYGIYGGGPEIILRNGSDEDDDEDEEEVLMQIHKEKDIEMEIEHNQEIVNHDDIQLENHINDCYSRSSTTDNLILDSNNSHNNSSNMVSSVSSTTLKSSKNVSFEDDENFSHQQSQQQLSSYYGSLKELKNDKLMNYSINSHFTKQKSEALDDFCKLLELKDPHEIQGKYQTQSQIYKSVDHITNIPETYSKTKPIASFNNLDNIMTSNINNNHIILSDNSDTTTATNSCTFNIVPTIAPTNSPTITSTDPNYSESSNSNYPKIIQNPQVTTSKLLHQHHHHQQKQQQQQHISSSTKLMSSSKRKMGDVQPLIKSSTAKVELKSYRKVDSMTNTMIPQSQTTTFQPQKQNQYQQEEDHHRQQQNQLILPASMNCVADLKTTIVEMGQNAENNNQLSILKSSTSTVKSHKNKIQERRRNLRKTKTTDLNNSDSG